MRIGFMAIFAIIMGFTVAAVDFSRRQAAAQAAGQEFAIADYTMLLSDIAATRLEAAGQGLHMMRAKYSAPEAPSDPSISLDEEIPWTERIGLSVGHKPADDAPKIFTCASDRGFKSCKVDAD